MRSEGKIGFRYYGISIGSKSEAGNTTPKEEETMTAEKCPRGWDAARVQRVLEYYESQTDEEVAAEIAAGLNSNTTVDVRVHLFRRCES